MRKLTEKIDSDFDVNYWKDNIESISASISWGGDSYYMDDYSGYKDEVSDKEILENLEYNTGKIITLDKFVNKYLSDYLYDNESVEDVFGEKDPYPSAITEVLEDDYEFENAVSDNTYNNSMMVPKNIDMSSVDYDGDHFTFFAIHQGGDVRGNYGETYVHVDDYESSFVENLMVTAFIFINFSDNTDLTVDYSDSWRGSWDEEDRNDSGVLSEEFSDITEDWGMEEFLDLKFNKLKV